MARKKKQLYLKVMRETYDGRYEAVNPNDVIITRQSQKYKLNEEGHLTIKLDSWSDAYKITIEDKVTGKGYVVLKSNMLSTDSWYRSYTQRLEPSQIPMRISFYSKVNENNRGAGESLRVYNDIDYQIDFPEKINKRPIVGKTEAVRDLEYNQTYTKEIPVIRDIDYRIYLVDKKRKPYNPHLKGDSNPKPCILNISSSEKINDLYIKKYRLQTFLQFKVKFKNSNKKIPKNIKIRLIDYKKTVKKTLSVNSSTGLTEKFSSDFKRNIEVLIDGKKSNFKINNKDAKNNVIPSAFDYLVTVEIPMSTAVTVPNKPKHKKKLAANTKLPIVYDLEKEELLVFKSKDYRSLIENLSNADKLMARVHQCRAELARILAHEKVNVSMVQNAEETLLKAEEEAKEEIEQDFSTATELKEIFLVKTTSANGSNGGTVTERRYVRREYFENSVRPNRINQSETRVPISDGSGSADTEPTLLQNPARFVKKALTDRVKEISVSIESEMGKDGKADLDVLDYLLPSANEISDNIYESKTFKVDGEAQWLRMVGSANMNGSAEWGLEDEIGIEGGFDAKGKLILCEGSINPIMGIPSIKGWHLKATFEDGITIDLGTMRVLLSLETTGFVGVKVGIEGAASLKIHDGALKIFNAVKDPKQTLTNAWDTTANVPALSLDYKGIDTPPADDDIETLQDEHNIQSSFNVNGLIGVEAGIEPKGGLEWLPPDEEEFTAFASMSLTVAGSYGIGGALDFYVFVDPVLGKFKIRTKAAACFGAGGKLGFEFEVDKGHIESFVTWTFYQLVNAGFRKIVHIANRAFEALTQLSVMYLGGESSLTRSLQLIDTEFKTFTNLLDTDSKRHDLAVEIMKGEKADMLLCATPNAKGILVYNISRHGWYSHTLSWPEFDFSIFDGFSIRLLIERKKAIIKIFTTVTTYPEWDNVLQHMTKEGEKSDRQENEAHVLRFLGYGVNNIHTPLLTILTNIQAGNVSEDNDTGDDYVDQYLNMLGRLIKGNYPKGMTVVANTDPSYEKYRMLAKTDYISPRFYAAKNPQVFDTSIFNPRDKPADGIYHA